MVGTLISLIKLKFRICRIIIYLKKCASTSKTTGKNIDYLIQIIFAYFTYIKNSASY